VFGLFESVNFRNWRPAAGNHINRTSAKELAGSRASSKPSLPQDNKQIVDKVNGDRCPNVGNKPRNKTNVLGTCDAIWHKSRRPFVLPLYQQFAPFESDLTLTLRSDSGLRELAPLHSFL
jgi:hypothetical protein